MQLDHVGLGDLDKVLETIERLGEPYSVWTFSGELGSGKTTLIRDLAKRRGIVDAVSSPTFNYVNDYDGLVYHFDCYRLSSVEEALNLGLEEYIDSGKPCWVEWPEVIMPLLPVPRLAISLAHHLDGTRSYQITVKND